VFPETPAREISTQSDKRVPHLSAYVAERWETRISKAHAIRFRNRTPFGALESECSPLKTEAAKPVVSYLVDPVLRCHPERSIPARKANRNAKSKDPAPARTTSIVRGNSEHGRGRQPTQSHPSQTKGCPIFLRTLRKGGKRESHREDSIL
jgi:hypothetical protein